MDTRMSISLVDGLEQAASRYPHKTAFKQGQLQISYADLHHQSERLSRILLKNNLEQGHKVAILMDKSIEAIVAVYGVLMAGGCYVPLDCSAPGVRNAAIVADCRADIIIRSANRRGRDKSKGSEVELPLTTILVEQADDANQFTYTVKPPKSSSADPMGVKPDSNPTTQPLVGLNSPALILYAPGEDSRPKGACYHHGAVIFFANWAVEYFQICADDVFACQGPLHFVISIFDLFASVRAGATVCLVPRTVAMLPASLSELVQNERITTWFSVPSVLVPFVAHGNLSERKMGNLRRILFGGEPFPVQHLKKLTAQLPDVRYYNVYGRTETNLCLVFALPHGPYSEEILPLGEPLRGVEAWLLDEEGQTIHDARQGELGICSPALMAGYVGQQAPDAANWAPHPTDPSRAIYRTGDWVTRSPGSNRLTYLGRRDQMIKIRGNRVENAEIEQTIKQHPGVDEVALQSYQTSEGFTQLRAFVRTSPCTRTSQLRAFCKQYLPNYMVPAEFTFVEKIPRLSNGLVDRTRLAQYAQD